MIFKAHRYAKPKGALLMRTTTTISQSIRCSKVFGQPFDKFGYLVADWLQCPLMTAKADIESNQRDQIFHPAATGSAAGVRIALMKIQAYARAIRVSIISFARNRSTTRMELIDKNQERSMPCWM